MAMMLNILRFFEQLNLGEIIIIIIIISII